MRPSDSSFKNSLEERKQFFKRKSSKSLTNVKKTNRLILSKSGKILRLAYAKRKRMKSSVKKEGGSSNYSTHRCNQSQSPQRMKMNITKTVRNSDSKMKLENNPISFHLSLPTIQKN